MGAPHHGDDPELHERFLAQVEGRARRVWEQGRINGDDDGAVAFAFAADVHRQTIIIDFGKPVAWIGLDKEAAIKLRDMLDEKLLELQGVKAG